MTQAPDVIEVTLDNINLLRTILVLTPYLALILFFSLKVRDSFYIKQRSYVQLNFIMAFCAIFFIELLTWSFVFDATYFLGVRSITGSAEAIGVIIASGTAIIGWLFTSQVSTINTIKANSIQILMQSRFSEEYQKNLCKTVDIHVRTLVPGVRNLSLNTYNGLIQEEKNAIQYMLNYFEFLSIGIRCGELDEELLKKSLRTIIITNFDFYKEFIDEKQRISNANLANLICLVTRWR
jgi:hypothetical protein